MSAHHQQTTGQEPLFPVTLYKMFSCRLLSLLLHLLFSFLHCFHRIYHCFVSWNCFLFFFFKLVYQMCIKPAQERSPGQSQTQSILKILCFHVIKSRNNNTFNRKVLIFGLWLQ